MAGHGRATLEDVRVIQATDSVLHERVTFKEPFLFLNLNLYRFFVLLDFCLSLSLYGVLSSTPCPCMQRRSLARVGKKRKKESETGTATPKNAAVIGCIEAYPNYHFRLACASLKNPGKIYSHASYRTGGSQITIQGLFLLRTGLRNVQSSFPNGRLCMQLIRKKKKEILEQW